MHPGEVVDERFEIRQWAGKGGMGVVYRALDWQTGRMVALKFVASPDAQGKERFAREAAVLETLEHSAIVRHVAHGLTEDGTAFLAMDWLEGDTLARRLRDGPLRLDQAISLGVRLAEALEAAHERGIVHRDLKPGNVVLPGGEIQNAMLVDFGLARLVESVSGITATEAVLGTPAYMAPEQARSDPSLDARADIYSLGCTLFHALVGRPPFQGCQPLAVLLRVVLDPAPRVSFYRDEVPDALDALVARMLAKSPDDRPQHARDVIDAFLQIDVASAPSLRPIAPPRATEPTRRLLVGRGASSLEKPRVAEMSAAVAKHGAKLELLVDGSILVEATGDEQEASKQLAMSARTLQARVPELALAIVDVDEAAADRAATLLEDAAVGSVHIDDEAARRIWARLELPDSSTLQPDSTDEQEHRVAGGPHTLRSPRTEGEPPTAAALDTTAAVVGRRWRRWRALALGAVTASAVGGVLWLANASRSPTIGSNPSPSPAEQSPAPPSSTGKTVAASEEQYLVRVAIEPPHASVTVDGQRRALVDGNLELRGAAGESFAVVVVLGSKRVERTVVLGRDGRPSVDRIVVASGSGSPPVLRSAPEVIHPEASAGSDGLQPRDAWEKGP